MINRMVLCLLSASLMVSSNFAVQPHQSEEFIEFDMNGYLKQHPEAQPAFKEAVMRNGNAAWNVAMKTIAHDTLLVSAIGGIAMATLGGIVLEEEETTYIDRIENTGVGFGFGVPFSLPIGLIVGMLRGSYKAHQTLQCENLATEHNYDEQHIYTSIPYNTAINIGASFAFACGLLSYVTKLDLLPKQLQFSDNTKPHRPLDRYAEATLVGASIATLGIAGYYAYNKYCASKPEDQRIQNTEQNDNQDTEVIRTARTLARDYTRTHKIRTLFAPASCTDGLY